MISAGLPFAGIRLSPFTAVCLSFLLNNSAYYGEIYRAGIESIGTGQDEAARSTGLTGFQSNGIGLVVEYDSRDNHRDPDRGNHFVAHNVAYREGLGMVADGPPTAIPHLEPDPR